MPAGGTAYVYIGFIDLCLPASSYALLVAMPLYNWITRSTDKNLFTRPLRRSLPSKRIGMHKRRLLSFCKAPVRSGQHAQQGAEGATFFPYVQYNFAPAPG